jgi:hypothetical protein
MTAQRAPVADRKGTALVMALYRLAGHWEVGASVAERSYRLPRPEREARAAQLRACADELLAIVEGRA